MPEYNFWSYVLSPGFLITFGLVMAWFAPLAYSIWRTWEENKHKEERLKEFVRENRRQERSRRRRVQA